MIQRMEVLRIGENCYIVAVDGKVAEGLTIDEAMGCMASALFADTPMFLRELGDHFRWRTQMKLPLDGAEQHELCQMSSRTMPKSLPGPFEPPPL